MRAIIAVDWGTTNRRAWRVEADGSVSDHLRDDRGVLAMAARMAGSSSKASVSAAALRRVPVTCQPSVRSRVARRDAV